MSAESVMWVKGLTLDKRLGYNSTDKLLLMMIADRADENGFCWLSGKKLCEQASVNRTTFTRRMRGLIGEYLVCIYRTRTSGARSTNLYMLRMGRSQEQAAAILELLTAGKDDPLTYLNEDLCSVHRGSVQPAQGKRDASKKGASPPARAREKDPIWDAVSEVTEAEPESRPECSRRGMVVRELKQLGATVDEIRARAKRYKMKYPNAPLTDTALLGRWGELSGRKVKPRTVTSCVVCQMEDTPKKIREHERSVHGLHSVCPECGDVVVEGEKEHVCQAKA